MLWFNDVKEAREQMASTRERARAAMATLDRRNPNLDDVGLNWSCWIDKCDILTDEGGCKDEDTVDESRGSDTMTLSREDMKIYGHCPALDNFYLVVCSHCGQLVKPQAFEAHCERRHGALTKLCHPSPGSASQQCPRPGRPPSMPSSRERHRAGETQEAGSSSKPASAPQHRTTKVLTGDASQDFRSSGSPALIAMPLPLSSQGSSSGTRTPGPRRARHLFLIVTLLRFALKETEASRRALRSPSKFSAGGAKDLQSNLQESLQYVLWQLKECDLDKHCGVLDPARKTLCTRQLMCNIHSIHQRRKVADRSKPFDQLVMEQRIGSSDSDVEKLSASEDSPILIPTPYLQTPQDPTAPQHIKRTLGTNCSILWSKEPSDRGPEEEGDSAVEVEVQPPYPFNQSLPSSGESEEEEEEGGEKEVEEEDAEEEEENGDIPAKPWHPKPLGICTFGSHTLGCSIFTFDRRLHHLRFALSDMVEQHVNAHLWKRIPQVPAGLQSRHPATTAQGSAIRPRAASSNLPSSGSPSSGPSGPKGNQQNLSSSKLPSAVGPYPTRIPLRGPGKAPLKGRELVPVAVVQDTTRPTQSSSRVVASTPIRKFPLHEKKDQRRHPPTPPLHPPKMSPRGPANRHHFSAGAKPSDRGSPSLSNGWSHATFTSPQPSNLHRDRGVGTGPGGEQQKPGGSDFRGPAQKRKMGSSEASAGGHPSLARSSKSHRSSSQSSSVLFSWRKGTSVGAKTER
ncbi:Ataxin-7-like protein 2 [Merluccius polli]|uniref:Ataxin-7-like protein 2 n=1 Tax=Merluccius polli TaxID=89951 RepID=A0AA47MUB0_MERPO|nr:Ataxin-7-like protein 2 [Merluccius polli]